MNRWRGKMGTLAAVEKDGTAMLRGTVGATGSRCAKRRSWRWRVLASIAAGAICGVCACSGDGIGLTASGDLPASGFAVEVQPIFDTHCTRCHAPGGFGFNQTGGEAGNGLDLTAGNSHGRLVNQRTFEAPDAPPRWRVLPSEPDSSYVLQKIVSESPKAGRRMPFDGPPFLSAAEIEIIRRWIASGAPND